MKYFALILFLFWIADTFTKIFILGEPLRTLWFSSVGLIITAIALFTESSFLITSMFSALAVIEGIWDIGFFSKLLFNISIPGVAVYAFQNGYPNWQFVITLYHLFIIPALFFAVIKIKKIHKWGWIGATLFTSLIAFLTYTLPGNKENINCIFRVDYCQSFLKPLYQFDNPERILVGVYLLSALLFLPLNYLLIRFKKWNL